LKNLNIAYMLLSSEIENAYLLQKEIFRNKAHGTIREISYNPYESNHIDIITGIRRCGKSTLLKQIESKLKGTYAFFNFEDTRIFGFEVSDFPKLAEIIGNDTLTYIFDEIQNVEGWELFIRNLHDQGKKIIITGSNASLLSRELGTKLTGRHINHELFPFSYTEFLSYRGLSNTEESYKLYIEYGGFPEYLASGSVEILQQLFKDIIYRDIAVRHNIRNSKSLIDIALYLISNSGKEYSYNKIKNNFNIGSANSVVDYVNWMEESYLLFSVPKFIWSAKTSLTNPKKIYTIDTGFAKANSLSFSSDIGRLLENAVFMQLKRTGKSISYYKDKFECDFILYEFNKIYEAIQVCANLHTDNKDREINGLLEALSFFDLPCGTILTFNQEDTFSINGKEIRVMPTWKWLQNIKTII
jgi:predicted AAA+ superfamily ATPase